MNKLAIDIPNLRNIFPNENGFREIVKISSKNPKYINKKSGENLSIYLVDENSKFLNKSQNNNSPFLEQGELYSLLSEAKSKCGRDGRKLNNKKLNKLTETLRNCLRDNMDEEDINDYINLTFDSCDNDKKIANKIYVKAKEIASKTSKKHDLTINLDINDLDYIDEKTGDASFGELIPLPITNFSDDKISLVKNGTTNCLLVKKDKNCGTEYYKKIKFDGNVVDQIKKEGFNNEKIIVDNDDLISLGYTEDEIKEKEKEGLDEYKEKKENENEVKSTLYPKLGFNKYKPTGEEMVEITYIYGPNRSGKTFYAAKYANLWAKIFKDWPIYLFSRRDKDKVLDDITNLNRVIIDETLVTDPISMTDFEKSLVIFDDIDTISDKKICKAVQKLRDDIMETGRQKMIYVINTSHLGMNWNPTRTVLNEANSYTLFPRKGNYEMNCKILKNKMGMKSDVITSIMDRPNGLAYKGKWGWITVYKDSPQYLVHENGVLLL